MKRALTLAISIVLSLLLLEALLRLHHVFLDPASRPVAEQLARSERFRPSSAPETTSLRGLVRRSAIPDLVYELKPELRALFKGQLVRVNEHGMRGGPVARRKPPGTLRIVGLGDSVMFGWGVAEADTYLARLQRCLDEAAEVGRFEILNFAVPGYNSWMEVAALESRALSFEPDLIVLHATNNDLGLPSFLEEPPQARRWDFLAIALYARRALGREAPSPPLLEAHERRRMPAPRRQALHRSYAHLSGPEAVRRSFAKLARMVEEAGTGPVLVLLQEDESDLGSFFAAEARRNGFRVVLFGDRFGAWLAQAVPRPDAEAWRQHFWISPEDSHPNALGHSLVAETLRAALAQLWGEEAVCPAIV